MNKMSRRDFIKLGLSMVGTAFVSEIQKDTTPSNKTKTGSPNIVVLVCDAMSARNLSLYGYPRKTTPNLEKLAERALVYHNHYACGNYTVPGTSSLLTGLLPWTHRAVNHNATVKKSLALHNVFHLLGKNYFRMAYTQNDWVNFLLNQFSLDIDQRLPYSEFGLLEKNAADRMFIFKNDLALSYHAIERMLYYGNSLLLSFLNDVAAPAVQFTPEQAQNYPIGFPISGVQANKFTLEGLFDGIKETLIQLAHSSSPFFSYIHIFPPHRPYRPNEHFYGLFDNDGYQHTPKRSHPLAEGISAERENQDRDLYDAFIANLDMEIGKLLNTLKEQGVLDQTYFIITSDHGETFERSMSGHSSPLLYEPLIRIPLLIFSPQNNTRQDFTSPTSNIDLLPTIISLSGQSIPKSCEGRLLPGLGGTEDPHRSVFAMEATQSTAYLPFTKATYTLIKNQYKLIRYEGYPHKYFDYNEFYDLKEDPEELQDKYSKPRFAAIISNMKKELSNAMDEANKKL